MKTKKFNLLAVALFFIFNSSYSQEWYFGSNAGLDFSGGSPVNAAGGQTSHQEGVGTQTDCNGAFLFYTNGINLWDASHTLYGGGALNGTNSMAQVLTCPKPQSNGDEFYVFYGTPGGGATGATIRYAIADASTTTVTTKDQNMPTISGAVFFEGMTLVEHSDGASYWLVCHRGTELNLRMLKVGYLRFNGVWTSLLMRTF